MKRRDLIKSAPLLAASIFGKPLCVLSQVNNNRPLCLEYLSRVKDMISQIRATESDDLLEASYQIARTVRDGGTCFSQWETGHSFDGDMFPGRHGDPDIFIQGYTMGTPSAKPKSGDLLIVNVLREPLEDPREMGIFVIGGPTPWCGDTESIELLTERNRALKIKPYSDIWINTHITTLGALMMLPGETAPLGPTSGAVGIVSYWAMIADAVRILARDKISVTVKGDEPKLPGNASNVSLNTPLAETYFETCLDQMEQIESELGTIKRIAVEAADRILAGGKLYVYSRYYEALCAEAQAKRGGLALINVTWAEDEKFAGTDKDIMIMGHYQPDDKVDLAMFRKFREAGMKIASIGPMTRDGKIQSGDTIPDQTDMHLGKMFDTYGLFAVPGIEKKLCPTSGLLVNQLFWATIIELAEEIIRRTGNTPAVLSTGALIGGGEQRKLRTETAQTRGY